MQIALSCRLTPRVREGARARRALVVLLVCLGTASAEADPLWDVEAKLGYGLSMGAGPGTTTKTSPLTLGGQIAVAVNEEPSLAAYGGFVVETLDRTSVGTTFGVRLHPKADSRLRLAGGGTWLLAPSSLWGAVASGGACTRPSSGGYCLDAVVTTYFAGSDLAMDHTVVQMQLVLSARFSGD